MRRVLAVLLALLTVPIMVTAQDYDATAPCGRDDNGLAYDCRPVTENILESTCLTSASPYYCLPYHQRACEVSGFASACAIYRYGAQCNGGDPGACNYYVGLLQANRACVLEGNGQACSFLQSQGF